MFFLFFFYQFFFSRDKERKITARKNMDQELLNKTYFITKDEFIKSELLKLNIKQSTAYQNNRDIFSSVIKNKDLCRGNEMLNEFIKDGITNDVFTVIFINNNNNISGLCLFSLDQQQKQITLDSICVPSGSKRLTGTYLLYLLTQLSNNTKCKITLTSDNEDSDRFYEKNNFKNNRSSSGLYEYIPQSNGGKYKKTNKKKKSKKKTKKLTRNKTRRRTIKSYKT